ncbi:hypothetical protein [Kitasatospora sp. GP82]|uniref:hypothetical protein n=1 Tax=Kitasatospora sp. GP82 TaxID=3035089 RepID=UPI0024772BAD|nr:hypothetical protein [Kitasatospora sp. GP82]
MTGHTASGRTAALPAEGIYEPPHRARQRSDGTWTVDFQGRDGRSRLYSFEGLPLPGMHADLAEAFARRTSGHIDTASTLASANNLWQKLVRLLRFLDQLPRPPQDVSRLTASHLKRYRLHRRTTMKLRSTVIEMRDLFNLIGAVQPPERVRPDVHELRAETVPVDRADREGVPGYDEETFLKIWAAARRSAVSIAQRIRAGEDLLARYQQQPEDLSEKDRTTGQHLAEMARTGRVPPLMVPGTQTWDFRGRLELAGSLFLTLADLAPLVVLGVVATGCNGETVKELRAAHRIVGGRAVVVDAIKRRRGSEKWFEEVTWDIGKDSERLRTAGGYYLFVERLTRRARQFSHAERIWSVWVNGYKNGKADTARHIDPFAASLGRGIDLNDWAQAQPELAAIKGFELNLNRLKTTSDQRYTRETGSHLPSSTRTNTQDVLFANYLKDDPLVQEWAAGVVSEAIADAEETARAVHRRALAGHEGQIRVVPGPVEQARADLDGTARRTGLPVVTVQEVLDGRKDTAFMSCTDDRSGPFNDGPCSTSFLNCFFCRNAISTQAHLPDQLALLDELAALWERMDKDRWWRLFGQAWLAINEDILPKFTPQERAEAERIKPAGTVLSLLEGPAEELWD